MGLTEEEVVISKEKYGSNKLIETKRRTFIMLLLEALSDPIIKILLLALVIKIIFLFKSFDWFETIGILVAVLLATLISSLSEFGSQIAFSKLQEDNSRVFIKAYRNNILKEVNIDDIVVNDVIILSSGDKVPADGYIIEGDLSLDESSLNGEAKESKKTKILSNEICRENIVYRGSTVYSGYAKVLINKVGSNTVYGNISKELNEKKVDSPLKLRLRNLAKIISKIGYIGAFLVSFIYLFTNIVVNNNFDIDLIILTITNFDEMFNLILYALTLSVTIIVVAVPDGCHQDDGVPKPL